MDENKSECPCRRVKCSRHGNCEACQAYHHNSGGKSRTSCERAKAMSKTDFITPPNHVNFLAKKLFQNIDEKIVDGSIAYLQKDGGGPEKPHTHEHNHLFIVIKGEAKLIVDNDIVILKENESYLVPGKRMHAVWNNIRGETIMVGISTVK